MSSYLGISPKNPTKYRGPNVYILSVVTRNYEPSGADYRQPETGKLYPLASYWLVGSNPTSGAEGDLWYLSAIIANVAYWIKVSSGSSGPLLKVQTQAATAPGVNPVLPTGAGLMTVNGAVVSNHSVLLETRTRALNTYNVEVQYATSAAATDGTKSGVAHFDSSQFTVDGSGFVTLKGGGEAIDSLGVQATSGGGTNPVVPDANGKIEMQGALVAAGTNPLRSVSTAANTLQYQVQTSQAIASEDSTKTGLSNFSSNDFTVSSGGFVQSKSAGPTPGVKNIGISYSGSTFSITSQDGTALSATNPGYVTISSKATPGTFVTIAITANQTFVDSTGSSTIIGNLFGLVTSIAYTEDLPFYIYAVLNDAENAISFMISRYPAAMTSPAAANIGKTGTTAASTQGSFFALSNPTVANYDLNPCFSIGCFRMRMNASDDWAVQALSNDDGIGKFFEGYYFTLGKSQFGAASGSWFKGNGPTFSGGNIVYFLLRSGQMHFTGFTTNCTANGTDGLQLQIASPYLFAGGTLGSGRISLTGTDTIVAILEGTSGDNNDLTFYYTAAVVNNYLVNNAFTPAVLDKLIWNVLANISNV